jgi:hypothetical protein
MAHSHVLLQGGSMIEQECVCCFHLDSSPGAPLHAALLADAPIFTEMLCGDPDLRSVR